MLLQHVMIWTCKSKILRGVTKKFYRECEPWAFAPSQRPRSDKFRVSAKWRERSTLFLQVEIITMGSFKIEIVTLLRNERLVLDQLWQNNLANEHCDFWMLEYPGDNK